MSENDDDDESAPQWFRQLQGYESGEELDMQESVKVLYLFLCVQSTWI